MAITMAGLCQNCENTYGMKLVAGADGLDSYVRWVHLIEDRDVPNFLHGSELVFVTGIGQQSSDSSWLLDFVRMLYDKNAVGLVVNIGPYIAEIPDEVVNFCENHRMPLFAIPWSVHLVDIIYDYCHQIVASEENEVTLANAFKNLIFSPWDREAYINTLERKGFKESDPYTVITFLMSADDNNIKDFDKKNLRFLVHKHLGKFNKKFSLFSQENQLVCIIDDFSVEDTNIFLNQLMKLCEKQFSSCSIYAGVGPICNGYAEIPIGFTKSKSAVKVALMDNHTYCHYSDIGVYKLLLAVQDNSVLSEVLAERLSKLEDFDKKNGTDYVQTLKCYLLNNSSVQEVAKQTFVHRNTINYKIKKIKEILGCELNYDDKLNLMLAFYIRKLIKCE